MDPERLHTILKEIQSGSPGYKDLVVLVHYSRSIAESYLVAHRGSVLQLCDSHGISLADLATDCIADIFRRDEEGSLVDLKQFIVQWKKSGEEDVSIRYRQFIILRMKSQLARTYAQIDSVGAKIYRNLKRHLRHHEHLALVNDFRGFVIMPRREDPLNELPAYPATDFEHALFARLSATLTVPEIIGRVCEVLMQQQDYRRSIPLFQLVNMVRMVYQPIDDDEDSFSEVQLSMEEIAAVQRMICIELDNRIFTEYVRKEKLTFEQAKKVSIVVREIISGWWDGQREHESVAAITQRMLEISPREYRVSFQTKIEYLVKLAKERFRVSLERDL